MPVAAIANPATQPSRLSESRAVLYIVLGLIVSVLRSYAVVVRADFIAFDDNSHIYENPFVKGGLTWHGVADAFAKPQASLWIPLTWLSFMADISLFGLNPGAMHAVNLAWHIAATVLLFFALRRLTGRLWVSAFVAALFGLHPLNVESVAWVTERKNVLSTFFWFASIAAYARFAEKPRPLSYLAALGGAALAMLAKPMAVTLPCTLLLLDFWPLHRARSIGWPRLVLEKVPFFLLAAGTSWMAFHARREVAVVTVQTLPLDSRISNALVSYVTYLWKLFVPLDLANFYPHPIYPQPLLATASAVLLAAVTGAVVWWRKPYPYLLMGWLWFVGVLVPVIGLTQIGSQGWADRFSYVPQIGIFLAVSCFVADRWPGSPGTLRLLAGPILLACALLTARQAGYWKDGVTLFEHTIAVTHDNACAYANAGLHRAQAGDPVKAIEHFQASLRIQPDQAMIWREFGAALEKTGRPRDAVKAYLTAMEYAPGDQASRLHLGFALQASGDLEAAITVFREILRDVPNSVQASYHLGLALIQQGRTEEGRAYLRAARNP